VIGLGTLGMFWWMLPSGEIYAHTMAFVTLVIFQFWNVIGCKSSERSAFSRATFNNRYIWAAILVSLMLLAIIMYVPFLQGLFNIMPLPAQDWALALVWTLPVLVRRRAAENVDEAVIPDRQVRPVSQKNLISY
jgi:P-type Ca2+ transporter type 2C